MLEIDNDLRELANKAYDRGVRPVDLRAPDGSILMLDLLLKKMEVIKSIDELKAVAP